MRILANAACLRGAAVELAVPIIAASATTPAIAASRAILLRFVAVISVPPVASRGGFRHASRHDGWAATKRVPGQTPAPG